MGIVDPKFINPKPNPLLFRADVGGVMRACELVRSNLKNLGLEEKLLALDALDIKVRIDGNDILVDGAISLDDALRLSKLDKEARTY